MIMNGKRTIPINNQDAGKVAAWLAENPCFFTYYPELLETLEIPHFGSENIHSLIEYQVQLLRKKQASDECKFKQLIELNREREQYHHDYHCLIIELIQAKSMAEFESILDEYLQTYFFAEMVCLKPIAIEKIQDKTSVEAKLFATCFKERTIFHGKLHPQFNQLIFSEYEKKARSAVLIPLHNTVYNGILAIGNTDFNLFNEVEYLDLLQRLGELVESLLASKETLNLRK